MTTARIKKIGLTSIILSALVLIILVLPTASDLIELVMTKEKQIEVLERQASEKMGLTDLLIMAEDLSSRTESIPYRLLDPKDSLDAIKVLETTAVNTHNQISIATTSCGESKDEEEPQRLCFAVNLEGNFNQLLSYTEQLKQSPFAHTLNHISTRFNPKKALYQSTLVIRVYTTDEIG